MNDIIKALNERKSVRVFENRAIPEECKNAILNAALQAPSAGNMNLYTILDITDPELKTILSVTCDNQPFIAKAPMVLVFCADYHRWYNLFNKYCSKVRQPSVGDLNLATADTLIAAQNCVVAAESLGIGSCYIGDITENFENHKELFDLPRHVVPVCMIVFGYPAESQKRRTKPPRFNREDIVFTDRYDRNKADGMDEMLKKRENISSEDFPQWVEKFLKRKYNSDFSVEMSRSCIEMIKSFCDKDQ